MYTMWSLIGFMINTYFVYTGLLLGYIFYQFILDKKLDKLKPVESYIWLWFVLAFIYVEQTFGFLCVVCLKAWLVHHKIDIFKKMDEHFYTSVSKIDEKIHQWIETM